MTEPEESRPRDERKLERTNVPGVYRRGNRYVVVGRDNRGRQTKRFAETLAEARDKKAELQTDVRRGEYRPRSRTLFTDYAKDWAMRYNGRSNRGLKAQTRKDYQAAVEREEFLDHFKGLRLSDIDADHLSDYGAALKAGGLSPRTIRNLVLPVRLCLATAYEKRHLRFNPAAGVKVEAALGAGERQAEIRALHEKEVVALLAAFDQVRSEVAVESPTRAETVRVVRLLTQFLLLTGARVGEALALLWDDFGDSPKFEHVSITKRIYKGDPGKPKSTHGIRDVPLTPSLRASLRRERQGAPGEAPVFRAGGGKPLDYWTAQRAFRKAADEAGLGWATIHMCRHTCASWLLRPPPRGLGASAKQAQKWLGHHSAAFTLDTYGHFMREDMPDPTQLDRFLGATSGATRPTQNGRGRGRVDRATSRSTKPKSQVGRD